MFNGKTFLLLAMTVFLTLPSYAKEEKSTYTLIESISHKYEGPLSCEFAVVMSADRSEVRVIRLDPRKGMYSVNYFTKSTGLFGNYGIKIDLRDELNLLDAPITTVRASFSFKDSRHDLILKAVLIDSATGAEDIREKIIPLDQEFFNDHPKKCLK